MYYFLLNEKPRKIDIVVISQNDVFTTQKEGSRDVQYISEENILKHYPINFSQRLDKALLNLSRVYCEYDSLIGLKAQGFADAANLANIVHIAKRISNLVFIDWESSKDDFGAIERIMAFLDLLTDMDCLKKENPASSSGLFTYRISSKGWLHIQELQRTINTSKQAFVAMWFSSETDNAWNSIHRAISDCGYIPVRIDKKEHNNQIVPEMLYEIKQSAFVIADLTGNRNGVYYEAGYAHALDKEVIVTWKKTDEPKEQPHFDIAQKNMIQWKSEGELYDCLVKRIVATVGKR